MHRMDGAGHVNNQFVSEDPATNRPPTEVTPDILNAFQEELAGFIEFAQMVLAKGDNTQLRQALLATFPLKDGATGLIRTLTPAGGARVRELGDIPNAATVGGIEYGIAYNCNINTATGVWAGRDVADICWLEKWTDVGGVKEFWYAPTAAAGAVPAWVLAGKIDLVNGIPRFDNSKRLATTESVKAKGLEAADVVVINANTILDASHFGKTLLVGNAASNITITLPPLATGATGARLEFVHVASGGFTTTIQRQGTDTIYPKSAPTTALTMYNGGTLTLEARLGDAWYAVNGSTQNATRKRVKVGTFTRDMTAASGNQTISGLGFIPSEIIFSGRTITGSPAGLVMGLTDGTNQQAIGQTQAGQMYIAGNYAIELPDSVAGAAVQSGSVLAAGMVYDQFTVAWTKTGAPVAGTASIIYMAKE